MRTRVKETKFSNITVDWNGGCEVVNVSGLRKGMYCNRNFYKYKNGSKICKFHCEKYIDVTMESFIDEEATEDEIQTDDDDFIALEDDGTKIINGKVYFVEE